MQLSTNIDKSTILTLSDRHLSPHINLDAIACNPDTTPHGLPIHQYDNGMFIDVTYDGLKDVDLNWLQSKDPSLAACVFVALRQNVQWLHFVDDPNGDMILAGLPYYKNDGSIVSTYKFMAHKVHFVDHKIHCGKPITSASILRTHTFLDSEYEKTWNQCKQEGFNWFLRQSFDTSPITPAQSGPHCLATETTITEQLTPDGQWVRYEPTLVPELSV